MSSTTTRRLAVLPAAALALTVNTLCYTAIAIYGISKKIGEALDKRALQHQR
jgi:hypothetical protein